MERQFLFVNGCCKPEYMSIIPISMDNLDEYTGHIPVIGSRYYHDTIDNKLQETRQDITQYRMLLPNFRHNKICEYLTYMVKIKESGKFYKPKEFGYDDLNEWMEIIYTWTDATVGDMIFLIPHNKLSITRKIYMTKPVEDDHLKRWAGKYHYQEAINCHVPPPTCLCCSRTRLSDPSEGDYVDSTETIYVYNCRDITLTFDNEKFRIDFNPYICDASSEHVKRYNKPRCFISYKTVNCYHNDDELEVSCPGMENIGNMHSMRHNFMIHKGKVFKKLVKMSVDMARMFPDYPMPETQTYIYPDWVTDETLWYCAGHNLIYESTPYNYAIDAIDFTNNQIVHEIREHCLQLFSDLSTLMPVDKIAVPQDPDKMTIPTTEHDDVCGICLEDGEDMPSGWVKLISCRHKFHKKCIIPHLTAHHKCPYCMKHQQMVGDKYETLIPLNTLLNIFTDKMNIVENNVHFRRLVELARSIKYEQFGQLTCHEDLIQYYHMYKDEFRNMCHVFIKPYPDYMINSFIPQKQVTINGAEYSIPQMTWNDRVTDVPTEMQTLVNGQLVVYSETLDKLVEICQKTWPDREIIMLPMLPNILWYGPSETPTNVIEVTLHEEDYNS